MNAPLFDSHCHINAREFAADRSETIARMHAAGLTGAVVVGCDGSELAPLLELLSANPGFLVGAWALHPEYDTVPEVSLEQIIANCSDPRIAAVGETGLDYHWCKGDLTWQKQRFERHIEAAQALGKPLIVHAREAEKDAVQILAQHHAGDVGFVLHCYGGDTDTALRAVDCGGMVSFTGVITFKNAQPLRDVVRALDLQSLLIETDCPYMAPVPLRGKRNEPAYVEYVAREIAQIKATSLDVVAATTTENARRFFKLEN